MAKYSNLTSEEFKASINESKEAVVIDVRTSLEYDSEHIAQAINIPNIKKKLELLRQKQALLPALQSRRTKCLSFTCFDFQWF